MYQCVLRGVCTDAPRPGCYASRVTQAQPRDGTPGDAVPDGVLDLLGLLAYGELVAFFQLSEDAALAPSLADKAALGGMAVAEFGHFQLLWEHLSALGTQPEAAMLPFAPALDAFHARTAPSDWLEGLVKAYVGDGIAADFYRAVAQLVDPQTRELVLRVLGDTGHAKFVIARVRAADRRRPADRGQARAVGQAAGGRGAGPGLPGGGRPAIAGQPAVRRQRRGHRARRRAG